jgi:hypothetical protein
MKCRNRMKRRDMEQGDKMGRIKERKKERKHIDR